MKRYLFPFLLLLFSFLTGYHTLTLWKGLALSIEGTSKEDLLDATRLAQENPDPFYRLGVLHQWSLLQTDLEMADRYFRKAIERNPLEQEYWLSAARAFQRMEKKGLSGHLVYKNSVGQRRVFKQRLCCIKCFITTKPQGTS